MENKSDGRKAVGQATGVLSYCLRLGLVRKIQDLRYGLWLRKSKLQHGSLALWTVSIDLQLGHVLGTRESLRLGCWVVQLMSFGGQVRTGCHQLCTDPLLGLLLVRKKNG